jgi:hypothetical protein
LGARDRVEVLLRLLGRRVIVKVGFSAGGWRHDFSIPTRCKGRGGTVDGAERVPMDLTDTAGLRVEDPGNNGPVLIGPDGRRA